MAGETNLLLFFYEYSNNPDWQKNKDENHTFYVTELKVYHYIKKNSQTMKVFVFRMFPEKIVKYNGKLRSKSFIL